MKGETRMKRIIYVFKATMSVLLAVLLLVSCVNKSDYEAVLQDNKILQEEIKRLLEKIAGAQNEISSVTNYDLFETQNMWTFILLDTVTGRIWQIQYDVRGDNRGGIELNTLNLAIGKQRIPGRFTLHKTSNMYNFILLDRIDGGTWQVQWSIKKENRMVIPIFQ
jgi:hypothetical protein